MRIVGFEEMELERIVPLFEREVDEEKLGELRDSIKATGVIQPIVVRESKKGAGLYELICGRRRYVASKMAGLKRVLCTVVECDDVEALRLFLTENLFREEMSAFDTAKWLLQLKMAGDFSEEELARMLGKSKGWVSNHLRMIGPIEEGLKRACEELSKELPTISFNRLNEMVLRSMGVKHANVILKYEEPVRVELLKWLLRVAPSYLAEKGRMPSVRELENKAEEIKKELYKTTVEPTHVPQATTPTLAEEEEGEEEGVRVLYRRVVRGAEDINKAFEEFKQMLERGIVSAQVESGKERASIPPSTGAEPTGRMEVEVPERTAVSMERPALVPSAEEAATTINDLLLKLNDVLERLRLSAATLIGRRVRAVFEHPYEEGEEDAVTGTLTRADRRAVYVEVALGGGSKAERMIRWYELKRIELA